MPLSNPTAPERDLLAVTYDKVKEIRVVDTDDQSKVLAIENLAIAGTKVTVAVEGIDATDVNGALAEHQADIETLGTEKVSTTTEVIAGAGLTGGGTLAGDVTLNVNTYNGLDSTSTTRPLSAAQGKALDGAKENIADLKAVFPASAYFKRVAADSGVTFDRGMLLQAYGNYLKQLPETRILLIPELGAKLRTSGLNRYGVKAYDMSANAKDAVQATDATQPYMTVGAAPNARLGMRFVQGQTQTGLMDFDDVVFAAGDSWTLTKRVKINSKGTGRVYLGAAWIETTATTVVLNSGTVAVLTGTYNFEAGRTYTIEFQYSNGVGLIMVGAGNTMIPIATTTLSGAVTFGQISYSTIYPADRAIYAFHLTNTRKSAYQSALDHTFLSILFPDMESVVIGNQVWLTDNFCGTVAGDGTAVQEVQGATTDGNAEIITDSAARDFSSDSGYWSKTGGATIGSGICNIKSTDGSMSEIARFSVAVAGKRYRLTYDIVANRGGTLTCWSSQLIDSTVGNGKIAYLFADTTAFNIKRTGVCDIDIDNLSLKEVGASDSTLVYNYIYAATTGAAAVKDLAATKAAAMWCHYDNLAANGAVYGKLYNWYAVHLFDLYPPVRGWRVPSKLDFEQLVANQGGSTVAGGRLKKDGTTFFASPNTGATNESGFSLIAGGQRGDTGIFENTTTTGYLWSSTSGVILYATNGVSNGYVDTGKVLSRGMSIRLLRNEPAGQNELSYTSGLFTTDITSAAKQIPISFGRTVDYIRIKSENSLTAIEAKLHNAAGTAVATLITGKTIGAGETKMFAVTADWVSLLQDGSVRVTAAGNAGAAVVMEIEVLTHKGVLS